jgi:glyoxylase-like metal-dependent hydrolase (beta-lactamase superfamily II)
VPLIRATFPVGALGCNCSILACPETREGLVIDPGDEAPRILDELRSLGVTPIGVVHTHAHFDHVLGTDAVAEATRAEVALHTGDRWLWEHVAEQTELFGMGRAARPLSRARWLAGGEAFAFGRRQAHIIHTPGHTPGSLCLYVEDPTGVPVLFSGDTLFAGSIGRTDLWGGSLEQILASIRGPLFALPETTLVIPGHGASTTIGLEREDNPFVRA